MAGQKNRLPDAEIIRIVNELCQQIEIKRPKDYEIRTACSGLRGGAIFYDSAIMLWVDQEYIAYCEEDNGEVVYVYATERHIHEQQRYFKKLTRSDFNFRVPQTVEYAFRSATREMKQTKQKFWVDEPYRGGDVE